MLKFKDLLNEWDLVVGDGDCGMMVKIVYFYCMNWICLVCFFFYVLVFKDLI